ncbi:hypothetical protein [Luteimonas terrae]|uniref:Uncharacterized protein n=1 Tax=Luteimonas terrae TaxID=1530191 RepID=A0ABU1Y1G7_9GAMM|nr:hypothetical protein [Luteimonas terrae]MDR7194869.1 hypothetical protein [Luteimonas terrae]
MLTCQRCIELNPVRARITDDPLMYRSSSCAAHLGQRAGSLLKPHPAWLALDADPSRRATLWRSLLDEALPNEQLAEIREYLQQQRALWPRRLPRDGGSQDPPLRGHTPCAPPLKAGK